MMTMMSMMIMTMMIMMMMMMMLLRCPELILALVTGLVSRLPDKVWLTGLHHHCSLQVSPLIILHPVSINLLPVQLLCSAAGACTRHTAAPSFVAAILNLLVEVCSCRPGVAALLLQDLSRDLWLPLSDLKPSSEAAWAPVRHVALQVITGSVNQLYTCTVVYTCTVL